MSDFIFDTKYLMANIFITISAFVLCVNICIPSANEVVEPIHKQSSELGLIVQWSKNNHQMVEFYQVPLISLDRLYHLAKVKENEVSLLYHKQITSLQLSDEVKILSEFQEENAKSLIKLNRGLWVSMTMDCYRNIWMRKLTAFQAKMKRMSILPHLKTLRWTVKDEAYRFKNLNKAVFQGIADMLHCPSDNPVTKDCILYLKARTDTNWYEVKEAVEKVI